MDSMLRITPRSVRRAILPASYAVFLAGTVLSASIFYRNRPFDPKDAILSDLQSPDDNPHGFAASAAAAAFAAVLLAPAVAIFYRETRPRQPKLAMAGAAAFAVSLASAVSIGLLAPFTHDYTPLHIQLACAAFSGLSAGTFLHLLAARASKTAVALQFGALTAVAYICYGGVKFDNHRLLTSLALWEWALCAQCAAALWVLAAAVARASAQKTKRSAICSIRDDASDRAAPT